MLSGNKKIDVGEYLVSSRAITLIALVITIIILIILAGVAINLGLGENGILKKAQEAKEQYKISQIKEKVELEILNMKMNRIDNTKLTIEEALQELTKNKIFESIDIEESLGYTEGYEVKLKYDSNESVIVEYVKKASGKVTISYKLEPESYTKTPEVNILFTSKGEIKSVTKPDGLVIYPQNGIIAIDYKVTANGKYLFKVENNEGEIIEKQVIVETIDTLKPKDFEITAESITNGFKIIANVEDEEETRDENGNLISAKSGIEKIEYYIKENTETEYTKYDTNEITGLSNGTYKIYAIAYDKAENEKQIEPITAKVSIKFSKISAGENYSLAIDTEGNLWAWGDNEYGKLGNGTNKDSLVPIQIKEGTKFKEVSAGYSHSMAIDNEGNLWAWGCNTDGQLGNGTSGNNAKSYIPIKIKGDIKFTKVELGCRFSIAIDTSGNLWGWGTNVFGAIGAGNISYSYEPIRIETGVAISDLATTKTSSAYSSVTLDVNGKLWGFGIVNIGDGTGNKVTLKVPTKILEEMTFKEVKITSDTLLAIDAEENLWAWGSNSYGQLGNGTTKTEKIPIQIKTGAKFKKISMGSSYCMAINEEGKLWTWGSNTYGRLGNGTTKTEKIPIQIKSDTKFKEISAGNNHSMAIDEAGNLWAWGSGSSGQLGNGTNESSLVPIQVN